MLVRHMVKFVFERVPHSVLIKLASLTPDFVIRKFAPFQVVIEPTTACNLRCPLCPRDKLKRKHGQMSLSDFKKIIDGFPRTVKLAELYFMGEPLLHRNIFEMTKYLKSKKIRVRLSTNAVLLKKLAKQLVNSGIDELVLSLDGASKQTHEKYRIGSDFNKIVAGVKKLTKLKGEKLEVTLQFIVMKHNEHEIDKIRELSKELGVDHLVYKAIAIHGSELSDKYLPVSKLFTRKASKRDMCYWAFASTILWNGDVTTCCYDFNGKNIVGNALKEKLKDIYKSKKYAVLRKQIINRRLLLCKTCDYAAQVVRRVY